MRLPSVARKIVGDLGAHRVRFVLSFLVLVVSVSLLSYFFVGYSILPRESTRDFLSINPASATLTVDSISADQVQRIVALPTIEDARLGRKLETRIEINGEKKSLWIFVVDSWDNLGVSAIVKDSGNWSDDRQIMLESTTMDYLGTALGDEISFRNSTGEAVVLPISGTIHDVTHGASSLEDIAYGYISLAGLENIESDAYLDQILIQVADNPLDREHIEEVSLQLSSWLEQNGIFVNETIVPPPAQYPHDDHMIPILYILLVLGCLGIILSGLLISSMVKAIISRERQQIGIMKTIGGTALQITGLYLGAIFVLLALALAVGVPIGTAIGQRYMIGNSYEMNYRIVDASIEPYLFLAQIILCTVLTFVSAFPAVYRGCRLPIREALDDDMASVDVKTNDLLDGLIRKTGRSNLLSFRNTLQKRGRVALMLGALAIGGGLYVASNSVGASMTAGTERMFERAPFDVEVGLGEFYSEERIRTALAEIEPIEVFETHAILSASMQIDDAARPGALQIATTDTDSRIAQVPLLAGEWLQAPDEVVIDESLHVAHPQIGLGDRIIVQVEDHTSQFTLVGVIPTTSIPMNALVTDDAFAWRDPGSVNSIGVLSRVDTDEGHRTVQREIDQALDSAGVYVVKNQSLEEKRNINLEHNVMFANMFGTFSLVIVLVGLLGLTSTITINVLERTKEIGILRTLGATGFRIFSMIQMESLILILLGWVLSIIVALPLTLFLNWLLADILNIQSLGFVFDINSAAIWLLIVVGAGTLVSSFPAYRAVSVDVREAIDTL